RKSRIACTPRRFRRRAATTAWITLRLSILWTSRVVSLRRSASSGSPRKPPPTCDVICSVDPYLQKFAAAQLGKRGRDARRPVETVFGLVPAERRMGQFDRRPPSSPRQQQPVQGCPRQNAELVWHATEGQSAPG